MALETDLPGVNVAGYFKGVMGTGEHARQLQWALRTQRIPVTLTTLRPDASPEDEELAETAGAGDQAGSSDAFNLLCVNADSVPGVAGQLGEGFFADRYTIGFWAWEVSAFPNRFSAAFDLLDEVWVGSRHVHDAVAPLATVPVLTIPQPVSLPQPVSVPPESVVAQLRDLPDRFRFLFAFDYLSVFDRKNPLGTIEAFARAFPPASGAALVIKTINHDYDRSAHERLLTAAASHPDIRLIEARLTGAERTALINAADCYVSLHRAEGFGYTLAEGMWLGKPVIATGYSGNLDYMTPENSYLVAHRLVSIGPGHDPYPAEGTWAEPDVDHAATLMREVFEHPEEAQRRGRKAASDIRATHAPEVAGHAMAERLRVLAASRPRRAPPRNRIRTEAVRELIRSGPVPPPRPRFGAPQRIARRLLLRLLKPVTAHQAQIDGNLLAAIEALDASMRSIASGTAAVPGGDESQGQPHGPRGDKRAERRTP